MKRIWPCILSLGTLGLSSASHADDSVTTNAYFRSGANFSKGGTRGSCFRLVNPVIPRFGSECDHYGEVSIHKAYKADEVQFRAHLNFAFAADGNDTWEDSDSKSLDLAYREGYVEATGALGRDTSLWVGKRFYERWYMDLWDFFLVNHNGTGFGTQNIDIGVGKLDLAILRHYESDTGTEPLHLAMDVQVRDIKALGGHVRARWIHSQKGSKGQTGSSSDYYAVSGEAISLNYGLSLSTLNLQTYLQLGTGIHGARPEDKATGSTFSVFNSSSFAKSDPLGQDANEAWKKSSTLRWTNALTLFADSRDFQLELGLMYNRSDFGGRLGPDGNKVPARTTVAAAVRPTLFLTKIWSVDADVFYAAIDKGAPFTPIGTPDPVTNPAGTVPIDRSLLKNTLALVLRPNQLGIYAKPQIRTYITQASWNKALKGDAIVTDGNATYAKATNGYTYGVQGEVWW